MSWISTAWNWLLGKAKAIFTLAAENVAQEALALLNAPDLQRAAKDAVAAAFNRGFKGEAGWVEARDRLLATLKTSGTTLKDSAIDTLLQVAYYCFKYEE